MGAGISACDKHSLAKQFKVSVIDGSEALTLSARLRIDNYCNRETFGCKVRERKETQEICRTTISENSTISAQFTSSGRLAVHATAAENDYVKIIVPKSEEIKRMIYDVISVNVLFRNCCTEELNDLVDVFDVANFESGSTVIRQGEEGEHFYVVEVGILDVSIHKVSSEGEHSDVMIDEPYTLGSSFGELALMYGSPRAATIKAREASKLWSIDRHAFRCITGQHKKRREDEKVEFLKQVKIGDKVLGDVLSSVDIYAMSLATQRDLFQKGDVIVKEGERGNVFYLIESGTVDVFKKDFADKPVVTLGAGQFFGEKALLSEHVRQATCVAASYVRCLYLMRDDCVAMLGELNVLLDASTKIERINVENQTTNGSQELTEQLPIRMENLEVLRTLGAGAFGLVKLVKLKGSEPKKTYALKCLSKVAVVQNGFQDHVLREKTIMEELDHPFILKIHSAMQDSKNVYFLLEVLLGGELFKLLRDETQFPESCSQFYAASVLSALCYIHERKIAYRDLKPENLVLDAYGFVKLVDFGLAKKIRDGKTWTLCGTPDYLAPEVILNEGHDWAVDYWALGVLIYELTSGYAPFFAEEPMGVYENIVFGRTLMPPSFSLSLQDLLRKLLRSDQSKRLGRTKGGAAAVMKHPWFFSFDWCALRERRHEVPLKPKVKNAEDTSNFDPCEDDTTVVEDCPEWTPNLLSAVECDSKHPSHRFASSATTRMSNQGDL